MSVSEGEKYWICAICGCRKSSIDGECACGGSKKPSMGEMHVRHATQGDGWIKWRGGDCPVPSGVMVETKLRSGIINQYPAVCFTWKHGGTLSDIVAYRVAEKANRPSMSEMHADREPSAFAEQTGGEHYKKLAVQPAEFCHRNGIGKLEGDVIYYVTRWRDKNGVEDLKKARHTLDLLIEMEERNA